MQQSLGVASDGLKVLLALVLLVTLQVSKARLESITFVLSCT